MLVWSIWRAYQVRVLHVITGLGTGGAEIMLFRLLSKIDRDRFAPVVVSLTGAGDLAERLRSIGVPVYTLQMRHGISILAGAARLGKIARAVRPDVIQGWMYHGNIGALCAAWMARDRPQVVWGIHHSDTSSEKLGTRMAVRIGGIFSRQVSATVYVSRAAVPHHKSIGYTGATIIIPNGFDVDTYEPDQNARGSVLNELGLKPENRLIGILGRYHPMKDHSNFLHAAKQVLGQCAEARFVMAGRGVSRENSDLWSRVVALGLEKAVHLLGERHDPERLMAAFDVYVSSSYGEAFPLVLGEAMACGVPCVTTDVGDSAYLMGGLGHLVPPRNADALASGILGLLNLTPDERAAVGRRSRARISDHFSLSAVAGQYAKLYERMKGSGGGRRCVSPL